jgi:hypothetical protein
VAIFVLILTIFIKLDNVVSMRLQRKFVGKVKTMQSCLNCLCGRIDDGVYIWCAGGDRSRSRGRKNRSPRLSSSSSSSGGFQH